MIKIKQFRQRSKGTSVQEYLLPSLLIGLVMILAITGFLNQGSDSIKSQFQAKTTLQSSQLALKPMGQNPALNERVIMLDNGKSIMLSEFPSDLMLLVEADGTDGATEKLLATMNAMIEPLLQAGAIDTIEAQKIRELATRGFVLGQHQKIIEQSISTCTVTGQTTDCLSKLVTQNHQFKMAFYNTSYYNKQSYQPNMPKEYHNLVHSLTPEEMQTMNQFYPNYLDNVTGLGSAYQGSANNLMIGQDFKNFVQQLTAVDQSLSNRPIVKRLVNYLSAGIYFNTGALSTSTSILNHENRPIQDLQILVRNNLDDFLPHVNETYTDSVNAQTQQNAAGICQTGQGQNEQGQCVPKG